MVFTRQPMFAATCCSYPATAGISTRARRLSEKLVATGELLSAPRASAPCLILSTTPPVPTVAGRELEGTGTFGAGVTDDGRSCVNAVRVTQKLKIRTRQRFIDRKSVV